MIGVALLKKRIGESRIVGFVFQDFSSFAVSNSSVPLHNVQNTIAQPPSRKRTTEECGQMHLLRANVNLHLVS